LLPARSATPPAPSTHEVHVLHTQAQQLPDAQCQPRLRDHHGAVPRWHRVGQRQHLADDSGTTRSRCAGGSESRTTGDAAAKTGVRDVGVDHALGGLSSAVDAT
jgi:hypothetical protein